MCVYSMIMDHYGDKFERWRRELERQAPPLVPPVSPFVPMPAPAPAPGPTPEELAEFRELLERARKYDREHGQKDCELDEKRQALKKIADEMGVDIHFA